MSRNKITIVVIVLLGVLLRLFILFQRGSLWFDEAFSVHFASMDVRQMLSYLRFENNPPLYFILLHFWMKLVGNSELAVRSLSMIFGIASIPLVYVIGKRLHSATAGLFASFLMAISTFQVFYSTETRMYSLYLFLALCEMVLFWDIARSDLRQPGDRTSRYRLVALFFVLLLLIWTHITAWFIVAVLTFYLLWQARFRIKQCIRQNVPFFVIFDLLLLSFSPWIINFIRLKIAAPLSQGYFFYIPPDKNFFLTILENFLVFGQDNAFIIALLSAVIVGLVWFAIRGRTVLRGDGGPSSVHLLLFWLGLPILIGFAFSNAIPRYFIAVAPALYLLLGIGFARYTEDRPPKSRKMVLLFPILLAALVVPDYPSLLKIGHHEWDKLVGWVEEMQNAKCKMQNECLVLINPHSEILPFERYYRGDLPSVGFYPRDDSDDRDLRIVKTNWVSLNTKENIHRLRDVTKSYERVFLVTGGIDPVGRNLVPLWFWEQGWRKIAGQEFGRISVVLVEKIQI